MKIHLVMNRTIRVYTIRLGQCLKNYRKSIGFKRLIFYLINYLLSDIIIFMRGTVIFIPVDSSDFSELNAQLKLIICVKSVGRNGL